MTKILIHGFGDYIVPLLEVVKMSNEERALINWSVILPTSHHLDSCRAVLEEDNIFCLPEHIRNVVNCDKNQLINYSGNIYRDVAVDKGYFTHYSSVWKEKNAISIYQVYKEYLLKQTPEFVLFAGIESYEGSILFSLAKEFNISVLYYVHTRNIGTSCWSLNYNEKLPRYMNTNSDLLLKAKLFLNQFREKHIEATNFGDETASKEEYYNWPRKSTLFRSVAYFKRLISEPNERTFKTFKVSIINNLPLFRNAIWKTRERFNSKLYQIDELDKLPSNFLFYPLQYSPESSINTLSPYFSDQMRVIDAIRQNMPSHYTLVVKEHPSCIKIRSGKFVKDLLKLPGVLVIKYSASTEEIIKKSRLVLTVSGTAALEAFLYGKPSLTFTDTFFSEFLGGKAKFDHLDTQIRSKIDEEITDDYIIDCLAKVLSVSYDFILRGSDTPLPTMYKSNIRMMMESILDSIAKKDIR